MQDKVKITSKKVLREKRLRKIFLILIVLLLFLLLFFYLVVGVVYNRGNFSITLDENLYFDRGLIMYDDPEYKVYRPELYAEAPDFYNISQYWLPEDITEYGGGSHNGQSYLAYTFYVENIGEEIRDYWSEVYIEDVTRNVDDAVRIRIYRNDEYVTFAKARPNGEAENNTVAFLDDHIAGRIHIENMKPGDIDKYTLVIWIEGSDAECTDDILGGEFGVRLRFNSEYVEEN